MIAEIHGKISSTGSNLDDRLEDQLTGNIFGTIRYLPFKRGLKNVLLTAKFFKPEDENEFRKSIGTIETEYVNNNVKFWPSHSEGEIDVLINFGDTIIGIEVKYLSGLSSDDQLEREARILSTETTSKRPFLLLLGMEPDVINISNRTYRDKALDSIIFGYMSWQEILELLCRIEKNEILKEPDQTIYRDMIQLLKRKGFERFHNFADKIQDVMVDGESFFRYAFESNFGFEITEPYVDEGVYYEYE